MPLSVIRWQDWLWVKLNIFKSVQQNVLYITTKNTMTYKKRMYEICINPPQKMTAWWCTNTPIHFIRTRERLSCKIFKLSKNFFSQAVCLYVVQYIWLLMTYLWFYSSASCRVLVFSCWDTGVDLAFPLVSVFTLKALLVQDNEYTMDDFFHL